MKVITSAPVTARAIEARPIVSAPVRGPGRPPGSTGGKDWNAAALSGNLPDYQINDLKGVLVKTPLLGKLKKTLPVFLTMEEQMKGMASLFSKGKLPTPEDFQAITAKNATPTGHKEVSLAEYSETSNVVTVEREELQNLLVSFCASFKAMVGLSDSRVQAYNTEKAAADATAKETADALGKEAESGDGEDDSDA